MTDTNRLAMFSRLFPRIGRPSAAPGVQLIPGHLDVTLVVEGSAGTRPVTQEDLDRWETPIEDLIAIACENLSRRTGDDGSDRQPAEGRVRGESEEHRSFGAVHRVVADDGAEQDRRHQREAVGEAAFAVAGDEGGAGAFGGGADVDSAEGHP